MVLSQYDVHIMSTACIPLHLQSELSEMAAKKDIEFQECQQFKVRSMYMQLNAFQFLSVLYPIVHLTVN